MGRIESITPEQWAQIHAARRDWLRIGSSTEPADRKTAEAAFASAYREIGREPVPVLWVDSPMTAQLALHVLGDTASLDDSLRASLRDSLRDSLDDSLWDSLWASDDSLRASLDDSLWDSLWASLGASLGDSLRASHRASLRDSLGDSLDASLRDSLDDSLDASLRDSLWASLRDSLGDSLDASLRDSLDDSLDASLRDSLDDSLDASLRDSLDDSLRDSLWDSLWASLGDSLDDSLDDSPIGYKYTYWWGQMDAHWVAYYSAIRDLVGVQYDADADRKLRLMEAITRSCGWWYPRDGLIIACERPEVICWSNDDRPRLHCEDGPAVRFRDGWSVYAWRGTRVPAEWIEQRDTLDPQLALTHPNVEQRRCAAEIIGWNKVLAQLETRVIDQHDNPQIGTLLEVDLPDAPRSRFLRVLCGTGRTFVLPTAPDAQTAMEAQALSYGLPRDTVMDLEFRT